LLTLLLANFSTAIVCSQDVPVQWRRLAFDLKRSTLNDCLLLHDSIAIAVGADGVIQRGANIESLSVVHGAGGLPDWKFIDWYSDSVLVCSGDEGAVGWSRDDGRTWTTEYLPMRETVRAVAMATEGALVASPSGLYRWQPGTLDTVRLLEGSCVGVAREQSSLVAAFANGEVMRSTDGGITWQLDENVSSQEAIIRLSRSNNVTYYLHSRSVTWRNEHGAIDTMQLPKQFFFQMSDVAVAGDTMHILTAIPSGRHAYSHDGGKTVVVMGFPYPYSTLATALSATRFLCVGERGEIALGRRDSAIRASFDYLGFQPFRKHPESNHWSQLVDANGSVRVISRAPDLVWFNDTLLQDESVIMRNPGTILPRYTCEEAGLQIVLVDTSHSVDTPNGSGTMRSFIALFKERHDTSWTRLDAPSRGISSEYSFSLGDGRVVLSSGWRKQMYILDCVTSQIDSFALPDVATVSYADSELMFAQGSGNVSAYVSRDEGMTWQAAANPTNIRAPSRLARGRNGRLFSVEMMGTNTQRIRYSDDFAATWSDAVLMRLPTSILGVSALYADTSGRVAFGGTGRGVAWSVDNGLTWKTSSIRPPAGVVLSIVFNRPDAMIVACGPEYLFAGELPIETSVAERSSETSSTAETTTSFTRIRVLDLLGRSVGSISIQVPHSLETLMEMLQLPTGVYLVEGTSGSGITVGVKYVQP
jgi:photosystem II stability/assembly factor-like uncharacterized protein